MAAPMKATKARRNANRTFDHFARRRGSWGKDRHQTGREVAVSSGAFVDAEKPA